MEEYKVHAEALKDQGNEAFKAGDMHAAIDFYTQVFSHCDVAIAFLPSFSTRQLAWTLTAKYTIVIAQRPI